MNDSKVYILSPRQIREIPVGELLNLKMDDLRRILDFADQEVIIASERLELFSGIISGRLNRHDFQPFADKADLELYKAGTALEWIKGVIATKLHYEGKSADDLA